MKNIRNILLMLIIFSFTSPALMADDRISNNYNYDTWGNEVSSAPTFDSVYTINENTTGETFGEIVDVVGFNQEIYIVDQTNSQIYIFDDEYQIIDKINKFNSGDSFKQPSSIAVNNNYIVVADSGNKRIVIFDKDMNYVKEIDNIDAPGLEAGFIPLKVGISEANDIYIIAQGIYEGIISVDINGNFIKYTGTNKVSISPLEKLWRSMASKEQLAQMQDFLPTEFTSLAIDAEGFIYTTTTSDEEEPIKRLNTNGENVLVYPEDKAPQGDLIVDKTKGVTQLTAIDVNSAGDYAVLDSTTGRIFIYDQEGYLLSIYGNLGTEGNHFRTPVAVSWFGDDKLLVADKVNKQVDVLAATDFLETVLNATKAYYANDMETAKQLWQKALNYNSNYELAYLGLGRVNLREGDYNQAAANFKLANNQEYYSTAFTEIRAEFFRNYFPIIAIGFIAFLALVYHWLGDGKNE